ncbi:MAG: hypothetical protein AAF717_17790 [Bacteroidota bacterium]
MDNNLKKINLDEAMATNGGGWLYDLYRIVLEEKDDFIKGFKDGLNNGIF